MAIEIIGKDLSVGRLITCRNCGTSLRYYNADVREDYDSDYRGDKDYYKFIVCPCCIKGTVMKVLLKDYKAYAEYKLVDFKLKEAEEETAYNKSLAIYNARSKLERFCQLFSYSYTPSDTSLYYLKIAVKRWENKNKEIDYLETTGSMYIDIDNVEDFLNWYNKENNGSIC